MAWISRMVHAAHPTGISLFVGCAVRTILLAELIGGIGLFARPIFRINAGPDISMKGRIWPIADFGDVTMLDRIVVNIVDMAFEIVFVANQVFPKSPLPQGAFAA